MWKTMTENAEFLIIGVIIVFGAIVHATSHLQISRKEKTPFTWLDFLVLWILANGSGFLSFLAASIFFEDQTAVLLFSFSGAVVGMAGTMKIANAALEFLALKFGKPTKTLENNPDEEK